MGGISPAIGQTYNSFATGVPADNQAPAFLGGTSPNDAPSPFTPKGTGVQSAQLTPTLATPFISLAIPVDEPAMRNAIPGSIGKLIKEKRFSEALKEIDLNLKKTPKNIQLQFLRSRIFIEQGKLEEARLILVEMTEKYPELPEPYNNLAVLYAGAGKMEQARDNLEMSLKLAPNDSTTLQNLADVYTRIAAQYYALAYKNNRHFKDAVRKQKLAEAITDITSTSENPSTPPSTPSPARQ